MWVLSADLWAHDQISRSLRDRSAHCLAELGATELPIPVGGEILAGEELEDAGS